MANIPNPLLIELYEILSERNRLHFKRNRARQRRNYYRNILDNKRNNTKRSELEKRKDISNDERLKAITLVSSNLEDLLSHGGSRDNLSGVVRQELDAALVRARMAEEEFKRLFPYSEDGFRADVPKKWENALNSDIKILMFEHEAEFATTNYEIARFTKRTTKRLRQILKEIGARLNSVENQCRGVYISGGFINFRTLEILAQEAQASEEIHSWLNE